MSDAPPAATLLGVDHVVLRVVDLERAIAFYRDVLGCTLERERPELGLYHLRAGSALVDLVHVGSKLGGDEPPHPERPNMAHVCFAVDVAGGWDAVLARLAAHGVTCEAPAARYGAAGNGLSVYIEDPEGNTVELKEAA